MFKTNRVLLLVMAAAVTGAACGAPAAEMPAEEAWKALPKYEYGRDMAALLTIDREVIAAMETPQSRAACAARLADLLAEETTTRAARQHICLKLRQVGTSAEVPLLSELLAEPETSEMARYALESIPGEASAAALRAGLTELDGKLLVGVINSLGSRGDRQSAPHLRELADTPDEAVSKAAIRALGNIADAASADFLLAQAERVDVSKDHTLQVALLRCAAGGRHADAIYTRLSKPGQPAGTRRAALEGLLALQEEDEAEETVLAWFSSEDAARRRVAAGHLQKLSEGELNKLLGRLAELSDAGKLAVVELAAGRRGADMMPAVMSLVESPNSELKQTGIRCLGMIGDPSAIPVLIDSLQSGPEVTEAAQDALARLPREPVTTALLDTLNTRPALRVPVIDVLIELTCYDAIDPLIEIASDPDPDEYAPALHGLRGIADPDKTDIPRLINLLLRSEPGKHRDEVEKTVLIVCDKQPAGADRAEIVLASLAKVDESELPKYLPLLGRLGGEKSLEIIKNSLESPDEAVREAAVRGLCNWPNARVADDLFELASGSENRTYRRWALRAYIRVVSLKSDRPQSDTLAMLQKAFDLAEQVDEKRLAIERAATVRTMPAVEWIASFLDAPELAQTACESLVELAHHRFLRHPHMDRFGPILAKVAKISEDPAIVERAKRYRLGL